MSKEPQSTAGWFIAAATASGIIGQQVAGKAVRDALFLSTFRVRSLPLAMAGAALLSLLAIASTSRLMARFAPHRILLSLFALSSLSFVIEWLFIGMFPAAVAVAVYLHVAVFSPLILSAFWSLINERFNPHSARTAVARIGVGAALGGVVGGLGAWRAAALVTLPTTVLLLGAINFMCLLATLALPRGATKATPAVSNDPKASALTILFRQKYLLSLATLVALGAAISSALDYVFSAQATAAYGTGAPLLAFFSLFGLAVSVLSLGVQLAFGRVALERLGIAIHIAVLPGIVIVGSAAGLAVPGLFSATFLRGAEMLQRNTLFRTAYELLYTPVEENQKRTTKALIDIGFDRAGTVLGSGLAVAAALSTHSQGVLLGAAVLLAIATLPLSRSLHLGYVSALKDRLREADERTAEPLQTREERQEESARDAIIEKLESHRHRTTLTRARRRELRARMTALLSDEAELKRDALRALDATQAPIIGLAVLLLADPELHVDARAALRRVANHVTGQLIDAVLDPKTNFVVRRRLPAVLSTCTTQRAVDGLLLALVDERFEVRYATARALARIAENGRDLVFDRQRITDRIAHEVERMNAAFREHEDEHDDDEPHPLFHGVSTGRVGRSVESIFLLLSLILDRDGLRLCFSGLQDDDERHRGTALEYLQTVLPTEIRDPLLRVLTVVGPIHAPRPPTELLTELTSAMVTQVLDADDASVTNQLRTCCDALVLMGAALARIWTYDEAESMLELRASRGMYTHIDGAHGRIPLGTLKIGRIASTRTPHITNQVIGDPEVPAQDWARDEELVAFAGYPLVAQGKLLGVVAIFLRRELTEPMIAALAAIAAKLADALVRVAPRGAPLALPSRENAHAPALQK